MSEDVKEARGAAKGMSRRYPTDTLAERLERYSTPEPNTGCILWMNSGTVDGYGQVWWDGKLQRAHRASYELVNGPIPAGMQLDHRCRVRCCINPHHLEIVTSKENTLRGTSASARNATKTHCKHGHAFNPDNTWVEKAASAKRHCLACERNRRAALKISRAALAGPVTEEKIYGSTFPSPSGTGEIGTFTAPTPQGRLIEGDK